MIPRTMPLRPGTLACVALVALTAVGCTRREAEQPCDAPNPPPSCAENAPPPVPAPGPGRGPGMGPGRGMGMGTGPGMGPGRGMGMGTGPGMGGAVHACPLGSGALTPTALSAAQRALADERRAEAQYEAVIAQFGDARPFGPIEDAERRHAAEIERLLGAHGHQPSTAPPATAPRRFGSLAQACAAGVESEHVNIALYDELLKLELPADERCVFEGLRAASADRHLPAFERCAR